MSVYKQEAENVCFMLLVARPAVYIFFKLIIDQHEARGAVVQFLWATTTINTSDLQGPDNLILTSCAFLFFFCPSVDRFPTLVYHKCLFVYPVLTSEPLTVAV